MMDYNFEAMRECHIYGGELSGFGEMQIPERVLRTYFKLLMNTDKMDLKKAREKREMC